ncbi:uncharacterized protein LOC116194894 [Punica granatum]|uniref:Uncharacterized protein LOC116194894 n=2 Tax=Punica granatum TaxID=22663 RepID=A0A6P8CFX9_PUNGR|nr:uncharacterized protein LOC116194894 [Punica granatum]
MRRMAPWEGTGLPESSLPWLWVIEYLASSKRVNPKLLYGIIESAPLSRDELGKNVRELVALACLEQFCGPAAKENETMCGGPSDLESGSMFEFSRSCEDVLEDILEEGSVSDLKLTGGEQLKSQVCQFVMQKRNSMPKPVLQQLKDAILEGTHPDAASLKVSSGLECPSDSHRVSGGNVEHSVARLCEPDGRRDNDSIMGPNGNSNSAEQDLLEQHLERDPSTRIVPPSKRNLTVLAAEKLAQNSHENPHVDDDFAVHSPTAKKLKPSVPDVMQSERSDSVLVIESDSERDSDAKQNKSDFAQDLMEISNEDRAMAEVPEKFDERRGTGEQLPDGSEHLGAVQKSTPRSDPDSSKKPIDGLCGGELQQREIIIEDAVDLNGQQHIEEQSSDSDGYQNEELDVSMRKNEFLVSQCTSTGDALDNLDSITENVCLKCNEGGQVLVCHTSRCPLVVHENCAHSSTSFDGNGNYFCPFCQYSNAISDYLETKKEAASVRNDLAVFIDTILDHQSERLNGMSLVFSRDGIDQLAEVSEDHYCHKVEGEYQELGGQDNFVKNVNDRERQSEEVAKEQAEPIVNGDLGNEVSDQELQSKEGSEDQAESSEQNSDSNASSPVEEEKEVFNEDTNAAGVEENAKREKEKKNAETSERDSDLNANSPIEADEEVSNENVAATGAEESGEDENNKLPESNPPCREFDLDTSGRMNLDTEEKLIYAKVQDCQSGGRLEGLEGEVMANVQCSGSMLAANNTRNSDGRNKEVGDLQEALPNDTNEPLHGPGCSLHIDKEDSLEDDIEDTDGDDESNISNQTINRRRRTTWRVHPRPVVPRQRQKKAPWMEEEVKKLKEGVEKFQNSVDKTIPWKKILEFGAGVFMEDRTSQDLKSKWTNVSRRYSKLK